MFNWKNGSPNREFVGVNCNFETLAEEKRSTYCLSGLLGSLHQNCCILVMIGSLPLSTLVKFHQSGNGFLCGLHKGEKDKHIIRSAITLQYACASAPSPSDMVNMVNFLLTLPETNSSHLKMDGWKAFRFLWCPAFKKGRVSPSPCYPNLSTPRRLKTLLGLLDFLSRSGRLFSWPGLKWRKPKWQQSYSLVFRYIYIYINCIYIYIYIIYRLNFSKYCGDN